jgi:hypothetical protein
LAHTLDVNKGTAGIKDDRDDSFIRNGRIEKLISVPVYERFGLSSPTFDITILTGKVEIVG